MSNEHFNLIARCYNRVPPFQPDPDLLTCLDVSKKGILLDAGGGTGRVAAELKEYFKAIIVVDISTKMLHYAKQKALNCLLAPIETLPMVENSVDRIIMMDAFHHLQDQSAAAQDLYRVLKPGGRILIIEPDLERRRVKILSLAEKLLLMRSRILPAHQIEKLFISLGAIVQIHKHDLAVRLVIIKSDNL